MGDKDIGGKYLIDRDPQGWVRWLLQDQELEVAQILSPNFQFVARYSDSLLDVRRGEERFAVLAELQLYYEDDMPERVMVYTALARQKYKLDVLPVVVYLIPPGEGQEIAVAYHSEFEGYITHQDFHVIKLWEINATDALVAPIPSGLLPYVPLMAGADETILRQCVARIRQEPDREQLETILALFAMITMNPAMVERVVRWSMTILEKSPIYQEILQKGRIQEREEWRQKSLRNLKHILDHRLGPAPLDLIERLDVLTVVQLDILLDDALNAQNWVDFMQRLERVEVGVSEV